VRAIQPIRISGITCYSSSVLILEFIHQALITLLDYVLALGAAKLFSTGPSGLDSNAVVVYSIVGYIAT
jgi:hypothetical protein